MKYVNAALVCCGQERAEHESETVVLSVSLLTTRIRPGCLGSALGLDYTCHLHEATRVCSGPSEVNFTIRG